MVATTFYPIRGGLDLITPPAEVAPGRLIASSNYEPSERGIRRMDGYERLDGRPRPSDATYAVLSFEDGTVAIQEGDLVVGASSGTAGTALRNATLASGSYGAGTAAGTVLLTAPLAGTVADSFLLDIELPEGYSLTRAGSGARINSSGNLVVEGANVPRFTYFWNGSAWAIAGLLNEDSRQNFIIANDGTGGVAGSPGTLPSEWFNLDLRGLTRTLAFGTENGIHYTEIRLSGSPTSTGAVDFILSLQAGIPAALGQTYQYSAFLKLQDGDFTNVNASTTGLFFAATTASPAFATVQAFTNRFVGVLDGSGLSKQRFFCPLVISDPTAAFVRPRLRFGVTSGQAVDFTVRIGLPQVEINREGPSSPIRTSGEVVTRAADTLARAIPTPIPATVTIERFDLFTLAANTTVLAGQQLANSFTVPRANAAVRRVVVQDLTPLDGQQFSYIDGEDLVVGVTTVGTAAGPALVRSLADPEDDLDALEEAVERARSLIEAVPGEGPCRGAWRLNGQIYAFRDAEGGAEGVMYRATGAGWTRQNLGHRLGFTAGTAEIVEGEVITGAASGATAVVERVVVRAGSFDTNDAVGTLVLSGLQSQFDLGESLTGNGAATTTTVAIANQLAPGGRYRFVNHNFFGLSRKRRFYAVNGVNRAMEWTGNAMLLISTGLPADIDKPTHVAVHQGSLFLGFPGGSLQFSAVGEPALFQVTQGAGEIGLGTEITGLVSGVSGALPAFGRDRISILFGDDVDNFVLQVFANDSGAYENSLEYAGTPIYCDARGLRSLVASDTFGNFIRGSISREAEPLFHSRIRSGARPIGSLRVRTKDQYRLFWDDSPTGVFVYLGREPPEIAVFELSHMPFATYSIDDDGGEETLLMAGQDGFVYQLDRGTSFDGLPIRAFARLPFNNLGATTRQKRFDKAILEIDSAPTTTIGFTTEFSYGDPDYPAAAEQTLQTFSVAGGGGFWEQAEWDQFFWSAPAVGRATAFLAGIGENISLTIFSEQSREAPHTFTGATLHFQTRGLNR